MIADDILTLAGVYEALPYFWQVTIFAAAFTALGLVLVVFISLLTTIRILAEGVASLLSFGRITFDETTDESDLLLNRFVGFIKERLKPKEKEKSLT